VLETSEVLVSPGPVADPVRSGGSSALAPPPPLGDSDLVKLKENLALQDMNFAAINSVSKESAIRKKELEQIMAAYRAAVDRLSTAYVQIKAERDTTLRIWEMMRMGPPASDGSFEKLFSTMGRHIKEDVCGEINRLAEELHGDKAQRQSYAGAVRSPPCPEVGRDASLDTLEIVPGKEMDDQLQDATATYNKVCSVIRPTEIGMRVDRISRGPKKAVRIMAKPIEIEKIRPALESAGLEIKQFDKMDPRLRVRDIPPAIERDKFIESLIKQNLDGERLREPRLIYWSPGTSRRGASAVIEVTPEVRNSLLSQERVYLGWTSCRVSDHLHITQCYKCLGFGHISRVCRADKDTCGHCSGAHESRSCPNRAGTLRCHNCASCGSTPVGHSAFDSYSCPQLIRRMKDKSRMIKY